MHGHNHTSCQSSLISGIDAILVPLDEVGIAGDPQVYAKWGYTPIKDDKVAVSNTKGTVSFAMKGPDTRSCQVFVNLVEPAKGGEDKGLTCVQDSSSIQRQEGEHMVPIFSITFLARMPSSDRAALAKVALLRVCALPRSLRQLHPNKGAARLTKARGTQRGVRQGGGRANASKRK